MTTGVRARLPAAGSASMPSPPINSCATFDAGGLIAAAELSTTLGCHYRGASRGGGMAAERHMARPSIAARSGGALRASNALAPLAPDGSPCILPTICLAFCLPLALYAAYQRPYILPTTVGFFARPGQLRPSRELPIANRRRRAPLPLASCWGRGRRGSQGLRKDVHG